MSLETGRSTEEQASHEFTVIKDLESAHHAINNWGDKEAPEIYRTRFIDTMLRIQAGDIQSIKMSPVIDPSGQEIIRLTLPIRVPALRNFEMTIQARLENLEKTEPNIRDLLPPRTSNTNI